MDLRPENCPEPNCQYLTSYDGRICFGRLPKLVQHDDLFNSHRCCEDGEPVELNATDAYYWAKGCIVVIQDVLRHALYNPYAEVGIDDPVQGLKKLLGG